MSIQFTGAITDYMERTATAPSDNANFTISVWVRPITTTYRVIGGISSGSNANADVLDQGDSANKFAGESAFTGTNKDAIGATSYSTNTWHFIAMRRISNTVVDLYVDTAVDGTGAASADVTGRGASSRVTVGVWVDHSSSPFDGRMAQMRIWTTNLSDAELAIEKASTVPIKTTSLWADYRMVSLATAGDDSSGNNRPLTVTGTLTTGADDPPGQTSPTWNFPTPFFITASDIKG